ncbi:MAG: hypothetical protein AAF721_05585 [Myxococcota bacterium]
MHRRLAWISVASCLTLLACPADDPAGDEGAGTGADDGGTAEDGDGGGSGQVDGESGTGSAPAEDVPARGLTISKVEANPGVAIPIIEGGVWVDGPERRAQIPKGRNTAFRVYVDIDEDIWVQREIEGRLTVIQSDGTEEVFKETVEIGTDSSESSLQSNFLFGVLAEHMNPGTKVRVEMFEAGGDYEGLPAVDEPPRASDDDELVGIEGSEQNMKIVLVPVSYSFGGCTTEVDTSEEGVAKYEDAMFQQNGLETIQMEVHAPLAVNDLDLTDPNDFFGFLQRIVALRAQENPDPNVYYYGLFDNCGVCIGNDGGCLLGVAPGTPGSSMGEAGSRAAIGTQFLSDSEVGIETFVHEIGHTQGRQHVACPGGGAGGPDITYPYENGSIGVWGFGVRDFAIRNPTNHSDYMSYCNPTWVSDWQWKATYERIRELSSWDAADMSDAMGDSLVLVGAVNTETGESNWWTDHGWVEPDDFEEFATLHYEGGTLPEETPVAIDPWSEGPWVTVRAPLAPAMDFNAIRLETAQSTVQVTRDRVQMFAAP